MKYQFRYYCINFLFLTLTLLSFNSCTTINLKKIDATEQRSLAIATNDVIEDLEIPVHKLKGRTVFIDILSINEGSIYSLIVPKLRKQDVQIVEIRDDADVILRIAENKSGVNTIEKKKWWSLILFSWTNVKQRSKAKSALYCEMIFQKTGKVLYSRLETKTTKTNIMGEKTFWILFYPITLHRYSVE